MKRVHELADRNGRAGRSFRSDRCNDPIDHGVRNRENLLARVA